MIRITLNDDESKKLKELLEKIEAQNINLITENILKNHSPQNSSKNQRQR